MVDLKAFYKQEKLFQYKILKEILPDKKRAIHINNIIFWLKKGETKTYALSKNWTAKKNKNKLSFINI